jgi:hypothetical protein
MRNKVHDVVAAEKSARYVCMYVCMYVCTWFSCSQEVRIMYVCVQITHTYIQSRATALTEPSYGIDRAELRHWQSRATALTGPEATALAGPEIRLESLNHITYMCGIHAYIHTCGIHACIHTLQSRATASTEREATARICHSDNMHVCVYIHTYIPELSYGVYRARGYG